MQSCRVCLSLHHENRKPDDHVGSYFLTIDLRIIIPNIKGLEQAGYLTSDTVLNLTRLPKSVAIVGGGYIAAEYGHFLSSMGSQVTISEETRASFPRRNPKSRTGEERVQQTHEGDHQSRSDRDQKIS